MSTAPFAWQDKRALRLIREHCPDYGSALAVYVALTVVASDKESAEFSTTHQWLAMQSGLSTRTVRSRLHDLARIGAVVVTSAPGGLRQPNKYRLPPLGNGCRTFGNGCRTFGKVEASPLPTSEEKKKRIQVQKPRSVPERIAAENRLKILKGRLVDLEADTSEQWQRDDNPELVTQKRSLKAEIVALENSLL